MATSNVFINEDIVWSLSDRGLDALNLFIRKGLDMDLAFELLPLILKEEELYAGLSKENR